MPNFELWHSCRKWEIWRNGSLAPFSTQAPAERYATNGTAGMETAYIGVHKCPSNQEATSKFLAPEGVYETWATQRTQKHSVPLYWFNRPGEVTAGVGAPLVYMQRLLSAYQIRLGRGQRQQKFKRRAGMWANQSSTSDHVT
jgi:hypothetical protein